MVNAEEEAWMRRQMAELAADERELQDKNDAELAPVLKELEKIYGYTLNSFEDLEQVPTATVAGHIKEFASIVSSLDAGPDRNYTVDYLLEKQPGLQYDQLVVLFNSLPPDSEEISGARAEVANSINEQVTERNEEHFLKFVRNVEPITDRWNLYYGFLKVRGDRYRSDMVGLLKEGVGNIGTIWAVADVASKRGFTELLPELKAALPKITDAEIKRHVQKAIDRLEKRTS